MILYAFLCGLFLEIYNKPNYFRLSVFEGHKKAFIFISIFHIIVFFFVIFPKSRAAKRLLMFLFQTSFSSVCGYSVMPLAGLVVGLSFFGAGNLMR